MPIRSICYVFPWKKLSDEAGAVCVTVPFSLTGFLEVFYTPYEIYFLKKPSVMKHQKGNIKKMPSSPNSLLILDPRLSQNYPQYAPRLPACRHSGIPQDSLSQVVKGLGMQACSDFILWCSNVSSPWQWAKGPRVQLEKITHLGNEEWAKLFHSRCPCLSMLWVFTDYFHVCW